MTFFNGHLAVLPAELRAREDREPMPGWRLHDLRRTARTLMSRAGVSTGDYFKQRTVGEISISFSDAGRLLLPERMQSS